MFGLQNFKGSCWVNSCIQGIFRIPEVQTRYDKEEHDSSNILDSSLYKVWSSKGQNGLKDFFESVKMDTLPAGRDIGDSHELLMYLCDKLPFLDTLCRFKIADSIVCKNCLIIFSKCEWMTIIDCLRTVGCPTEVECCWSF